MLEEFSAKDKVIIYLELPRVDANDPGLFCVCTVIQISVDINNYILSLFQFKLMQW